MTEPIEVTLWPQMRTWLREQSRDGSLHSEARKAYAAVLYIMDNEAVPYPGLVCVSCDMPATRRDIDGFNRCADCGPE